MRVEDLRPRGAAWMIRLHEKGGKHHTMPCHHALAEALHAYIAAAGIAEDLDEACLPLGEKADAEAFVHACRTLRYWPRELTVDLDAQPEA